MKQRIISWNVNGIRAAEKKGMFSWLEEASPDIFCVQETKAQKNQLSEIFINPGVYKSYWSSAKRKGYSGVALYTKEEPESVSGLGIGEFDDEGRVLAAYYSGFVLINAYFPNSQAEGARLPYKLAFCDALLQFSNSLIQEGKHVVICGDYNIAHKPIDLANPKRNETNPGYLPEERAWMDSFTSGGYTDTFRMFHNEPGQYTWWSYRFNAREKNIGWRIDYFCVNDAFAPKVGSSIIHADVFGSDHCPIELTLN